jgi:hypothetical protein
MSSEAAKPMRAPQSDAIASIAAINGVIMIHSPAV